MEAALIYSDKLDAELWVTDNPKFVSPDGNPVYQASELRILSTKTDEQLKHIHAVKLAFGGGLVRR